MSEETVTDEARDVESGAAGSGEYKSEVDSDDNVEAQWSVAVLPGESVSVHFEVRPKSEEAAVNSVQASFVAVDRGIVTHSFAGSSVLARLASSPGQGFSGDSGVDLAVFAGYEEAELEAVLAGSVRKGEEDVSFFFRRPFKI